MAPCREHVASEPYGDLWFRSVVKFRSQYLHTGVVEAGIRRFSIHLYLQQRVDISLYAGVHNLAHRTLKWTD